MRDLFIASAPNGKENLKRFPTLRHHNPKVSGLKPLCVKYQSKGRCRVGCSLAHILPGKMSAILRSKTDEAYRKAYL
jgi:hypothetical protein